MKFQKVVANPPFSLDKWDSGFLSEAEADSKGKKKMTADLDPYHRFDLGIPPASKGDYAFVLHMLSSLDGENGRMAIVLPHGVLFRGASEGKIRRQLVELNYLDAVIGLPANLFYGTGIPACILVFQKNRPRRDVLFIDASAEGNYEKGKTRISFGIATSKRSSRFTAPGKMWTSMPTMPASMRLKKTTLT